MQDELVSKTKRKQEMHELHPDKGGNDREFDSFLTDYRAVKKRFLYHMPELARPALPSTVKFTPIEQVLRNKAAAKARAYRRKHRKTYLAYRRRYYQKQKAEGKIVYDESKRAARLRYGRRHRRKCNNAQRRYRQANPEKVKLWRATYKKRLAERGVEPKRRIHGTPADLAREKLRRTPGTPEYEARRKWRLKYNKKNRRRIIAGQRRRYRVRWYGHDGKPPKRERDHKGVFLPRPMAVAA